MRSIFNGSDHRCGSADPRPPESHMRWWHYDHFFFYYFLSGERKDSRADQTQEQRPSRVLSDIETIKKGVHVRQWTTSARNQSNHYSLERGSVHTEGISVSGPIKKIQDLFVAERIGINLRGTIFQPMARMGKIFPRFQFDQEGLCLCGVQSNPCGRESLDIHIRRDTFQTLVRTTIISRFLFVKQSFVKETSIC